MYSDENASYDYYYGDEDEGSLSIDMILEGRADPGIYVFIVAAALFLGFMTVFVVTALGMGYDGGCSGYGP